ncbi:MAG: L-2-amino-thiazoline-4-carboxylic acid hydrolase [Suipraeoptans sp.]
MNESNVTCQIEHHATMFALLSKYAITLRGDEGKDAILKAMTKYGNERGARMAKNALANGDPLTTTMNQAYGEWKPDYPNQMDFGRIHTQPTLQTYIAKCAWCDAWHHHDLMEFGKYYCVDVDNAVYQGFNPDFKCTPTTDAMSWGGMRCEFDWGRPLTEDDVALLDKKKSELGTSCMKDFNFHTAHLYYSISNTLKEELGDIADEITKKATSDYIDMFGHEYFDAFKGKYNANKQVH